MMLKKYAKMQHIFPYHGLLWGATPHAILESSSEADV